MASKRPTDWQRFRAACAGLAVEKSRFALAMDRILPGREVTWTFGLRGVRRGIVTCVLWSGDRCRVVSAASGKTYVIHTHAIIGIRNLKRQR